eukprot:m.183397 g.183397  ORF g.183397 m.183397 type:complete len:80 (+) comp18078_c1_seq4:378-617(+)
MQPAAAPAGLLLRNQKSNIMLCCLFNTKKANRDTWLQANVGLHTRLKCNGRLWDDNSDTQHGSSRCSHTAQQLPLTDIA